MISGLHTQHFRKDLLPRKSDLPLPSILKVLTDHLRLKRPKEEDSKTYNILQRLSYLAVVFVLLPLMFVSGFAMSPAITSVFPVLVTVFGGHQSARTLHFFAANLLFLFLVIHISMVSLAGLVSAVRSVCCGSFRILLWAGLGDRLRSRRYLERFHRSLKEEEVWTAEYRSVEEPRTSIACWVEEYNHDRPHRGVQNRTPHEGFLAFATDLNSEAPTA